MAELDDKSPIKNLYDAASKEYDLGTYEDFTKSLLKKENIATLYNTLSKDYDLGTIDEFSWTVQNYNGIADEAPKKKGATVSQSPLGQESSSLGGNQNEADYFGLSQEAVSKTGSQQRWEPSANGGGRWVDVPTADNTPNIKSLGQTAFGERQFGGLDEVVAKPQSKTGLGALQTAPFTKTEKVSPVRDKTIPDLTKNKKVQNTLTKFNDVKAAKDNLTSLQGQYDEFLQTGTIDGQRIDGYDPGTGSIVPFSPAAQIKSDLETALNTQKDLTVEKVKDFNKDMPSTKDHIIVDLPKGVGGELGGDVLSLQIPAQVQAIEFAQKTSDLENKYHELGTDINTALKLSEDIGASSFLDDKQQLLYKALQSKDEKLIDEAMGFVYKDLDNKIADLNKRIISGEGGQDLIDQRNELITQKSDFLSPTKTLAKIAQIDGSVNAVEEIYKGIHPQDKLRIYYLHSFNDATELAQKLIGQPLFITEGGKSTLNPKVANYLSNTTPQVTYGTQKEDKQKLQDAVNIMQLSAPAVLLNKQPIEKGGNFLESAGKTFAGAIGLDTGGLNLKKQTEKGSMMSNILNEAGAAEFGKGQGEKLGNISKESWGEFGGTTIGYLAALIPTLVVGGAELKAGKAIAGEIGGGAIGRGIRALLSLTDKDTMLGRALKLGAEAKLAGATFGDKDNNLGIANIGAESIGSEVIEKALGKTKAGKFAAAVINKMFGKNAGVAFKTIAKANAMGLAETVGETTGTLVQLYQDSPTYTEFIDNVKQQFGDPSEALKFFIATYGLGAVLGGHASPVSKDVDATQKEAYDKLTPEEKDIADKVMAQDVRANDNTILEYVKDNLDKIPEDIKTQQVADLTKAKEELDKVVEGEPYDIKVGDFHFTGKEGSTLQVDKDYVNTLTNEYNKGKETQTTPTEQQTEPTPESGGVGAEAADPLKNIESTEKALDSKLEEGERITSALIPDDVFTTLNDEGGSMEKIISKAYHLAKKDGSNPKLVKAVEDLLAPSNTLIKETPQNLKQGEPLVKGSDTANLPQDVQNEIADLRAKEETEVAKIIPNVEEFKTDGRVDKKKVLAGIEEARKGELEEVSAVINKADKKTLEDKINDRYNAQKDAYNKIYDEYDAKITPLLEQGKKTAQVTEPVTEKQVADITVGEMIDKTGTYKGEKGKFYQDGQTVIFSVDNANKEYELGNIEEVKNTPIADFEITHEKSVVKPNDDGTFNVRGKDYKNNYSDPLSAINRDSNGNVVSVNLETADGKKRTFKGNVAEDIAYQIHLQEINKNNETRTEFEQHINEDAEARQQINDAAVPTTTPPVAAKNNAKVSREKIKPKVVAETPKITKPQTTQKVNEGQAKPKTESTPTNKTNLGENKNAAEKTTEQRKAEVAAIVDKLADKLKAKLGSNPNVQKQGIGADEIVDFIAQVVKDLANIGIDTAEAIKTARNKLKELGVDEDLVNKAEAKYSGKEQATDKEVDKVAEATGTKAKNIRDLYDINRKLFGQDRVKSLAAAVAMDRMIGVMAKRAGTTKAEMYARLEFKKDTEANVLKADNALFQGTINGEGVTLRNTDVDVVNGFYSPLRKIIAEAKQDKMPAKQWAEKFAKGDEAKWTGLTDWLAQQQGSVSKADILAYLKDNRINVVEVVKGKTEWNEVGKNKWERPIDKENPQGRKTSGKVVIQLIEGKYYGEASTTKYTKVFNSLEDAKSYYDGVDSFSTDTKFSKYQLEGNKSNYKEVLVTLPQSKQPIGKWEYYKQNGIENAREFENLPVDKKRQLFDDWTKEIEKTPKTPFFKSSHFDEPNILVHLRMNTRTDAEGNKVLFLEEVQSDWGQKGKKEGFKTDEGDRLVNFRNEMKRKYGDSWYNDRTAEEVAKDNELLRGTGGQPSAPFVTDTNAWVKLGLKVALKEAVAQGATKIAWTTGEQQNDRYDLSKVIENITVTNDGLHKDGYTIYKVKSEYKSGEETFGYYRAEELPNVLGKDLADKILADDLQKGEKEIYEGVDLKVGGKGMKGFYGSPTEGSLGIVGNVAKSLFKQDVGTVEFKTKGKQEYTVGKTTEDVKIFSKRGDSFTYNGDPITKQRAFEIVERGGQFEAWSKSDTTQNSITVTPEMRTQVQNGLALFQKQQGQNAKGAMVAADGNFVIYALTDPNVSTPLHEVAHVFEHYLTDGERATINNWAKTGAWTTETSEKFARGFEKYLSEGVAPTEGLKKVFEKFKTWLSDIYNGIKGSDIDIELNDDMRSIYAQMLGEDAVPAKKAKAVKIEQAPISDTQIDDLLKGKNRKDIFEELGTKNPDLETVARKVTNAADMKYIRDILENKDGKYDKQLGRLEKKLGLKKIC